MVYSTAAEDKRHGLAFYNYHSTPFSCFNIDALIKFVSSQFSLNMLHFFFCCDVRATPSEILDFVEKLPDWEILHMSFTTNELFEKEISNRIRKRATVEEIILITDKGTYPILDQLDNIVIFHPPQPLLSFPGHRVISLPSALTLDRGTSQLIGLNKSLDSIADNITILQNKMSEMKTPILSSKKNPEELTALLLKGSILAKQLIEKKRMELKKKKEEEEAKTIIAEDDEEVPMHQSNGWDSFPNADLTPITNGWEEVDKEMEAERSIRPGGGINPFSQFKKNPFANPFEPKIHRRPMIYNQDLYENRVVFEPSKLVVQKGNSQERNPFEKNNLYASLSRLPPSQQQIREDFTKNNSFISAGEGNNFQLRGSDFKKPAPQCPQWEDRAHRALGSCPFWHPHKPCMFFPKCRIMAANCGYAHPFCVAGECLCSEENKDPQLNHFFTDE